jgi:hypothetical protein
VRASREIRRKLRQVKDLRKRPAMSDGERKGHIPVLLIPTVLAAA